MRLCFFAFKALQLFIRVSHTNAASCSTTCEQEVTQGCMNFHNNAGKSWEEARAQCRHEIDNSIGKLAQAQYGCVPNCDFTSVVTNYEGGVRNPPNPGSQNQDHVIIPAVRPSTPTLCNDDNRGRCECYTDTGFSTYTWWVEDTWGTLRNDGATGLSQRCASVYIPSGLPNSSPVVMSLQCYNKDQWSLNVRNGDQKSAADRFQYSVIFLSTPNGGWDFGNNGKVNDANPMLACTESVDALYVRDVLEHIVGGSMGSASVVSGYDGGSKVDTNRIFAHGFSQNGMFAGWASMCFGTSVTTMASVRIAGAWQGGAGMAIANQDPTPPGAQSMCTQSEFVDNGNQCTVSSPCGTACKYWPVYPCYDPQKILRHCAMTYTNDQVVYNSDGQSHPDYVFTHMSKEKHDVRKLFFSPSAEFPGGHSSPPIPYDWMVGCLGISASTCSSGCESAVVSCISGKSGSPDESYKTCYEQEVTNGNCVAACGPTIGMLNAVATPSAMTLSRGVFGAGSTSQDENVAVDSVCTATSSLGTLRASIVSTSPNIQGASSTGTTTVPHSTGTPTTTLGAASAGTTTIQDSTGAPTTTLGAASAGTTTVPHSTGTLTTTLGATSAGTTTIQDSTGTPTTTLGAASTGTTTAQDLTDTPTTTLGATSVGTTTAQDVTGTATTTLGATLAGTVTVQDSTGTPTTTLGAGIPTTSVGATSVGTTTVQDLTGTPTTTLGATSVVVIESSTVTATTTLDASSGVFSASTQSKVSRAANTSKHLGLALFFHSMMCSALFLGP